MHPFINSKIQLIFSVWLCNVSVIKSHNVGCTGLSYDYNGQSICYWLVTSNLKAYDADQECQTKGGFLAYIPNESALDVVTSLKNTAGHVYTPEFFIGYEENNGVLSIRGTDIVQQWASWRSGQPNSRSEECVIIYNIGSDWWDEHCQHHNYAVCSDYVPGRSVIETVPPESTEQPTTTNELTTEQTTTEDYQTTTLVIDHTSATGSCTCTCTSINKTQDIQALTEQIKKEMVIDRTTLSSHIRKLNSAEDARTSSANIGYVGVLIMSITFGSILLIDISKTILYLKNCLRN